MMMMIYGDYCYGRRDGGVETVGRGISISIMIDSE